MKKYRSHLLLGIIIFLGLITRIYGINWDQGNNLHPDERAIILFTLDLSFPTSIGEFFSPESSWNPHFFAYGSLPLYLLYSIAGILSPFFPQIGTYDYIVYVGRMISACIDVGIITALFFLGKLLVNKTVGIITSFFYLCSTFALQAAHFYAVDTPLTFFSLVTLVCLLYYEKTHKKRKLIGAGFFFGCALATKISAIILLFPILLFLLLYSLRHKKKYLSQTIVLGVRHGLMLFFPTVLTFFIFEPYAVISFPEFFKQTLEQSHMTKSAFTFPYTLQYVGKIPYLYELTQIFFWGQGIVLASICFGGTIYIIYKTVAKQLTSNYIILLSFFSVYFLVVGNFAVGFMRYMLPLYPLLCLFGGIFFYHVLHLIPPKKRLVILVITGILIAIPPLSFLHIYKTENTRVQATRWIDVHIPSNSVVAVEHWDDILPLRTAANYQMEILELYNPDTAEKWETISKQLERSEYIILASQRLSTPLQKLTECDRLPSEFCYKKTAQYYKDLFSGKLGFKKIAEFFASPTIPFTNFAIDDSSADESFSVYDHPKVLIYKKL